MMLHHQRRCVAPLLRHVQRSLAYRHLSDSKDDAHGDFREQLKELQEERELLFGFTDDETSAWQQSSLRTLEKSHMDAVNESRLETQPLSEDAPSSSNFDHEQQQPFTHISQDGAGATMVDVGDKQVTRRVARAQTRVVFPPEVMSAFQQQNSGELVGPKGPIFATAKLAGIMAAKKTSDLIPLCHPLPLDKVHVDISLLENVATVECECRVTHKTGVEMEALTGATVAALTIYDMVKAVSHRVEISNTKLINKSGGKRTIQPE